MDFYIGASYNSSGCMDGATNVTDENSEVIPANGVHIKQSKIGDIPCSKLDKHGKHINYTLKSTELSLETTIHLLFSRPIMLWSTIGWREGTGIGVGGLRIKLVIASSLTFEFLPIQVVSAGL